ncbi:Transmembrane nucleoporin [Entomophthora muscae]|uniref:Transmembrane nucleoporin n=1 Tax=Entomophthora muscae TaxID=34485 RepID=A0ACC2RSN3_9FUNG|nr:Transmembrane nucleoporin [Entomophthora muscae]
MEVSSQSAWAYPLVFLSSIVTYGLILLKAGESDARLSQKFQRLLFTETGAYLLLSVVWTLYPPILTAPLPYILYSLIHAVNFLRTNVLFCFFPRAEEEIDRIKRNPSTEPVLVSSLLSLVLRDFIYRMYAMVVWMISKVEILVTTPLLLLFCVYSKKITPLILYLYFLFQRFRNSVVAKRLISQFTSAADAFLLSDDRNPVLRSAYSSAKSLLGRRFQPQPQKAPTALKPS